MKRDWLDDLVSEYTRKRAMVLVGGCERCLTQKHDIIKENGDIFPSWKQLQCSHFKGRSKKSVRYDEDNTAGLCPACHIYFGAHPDEHQAFFLKRLGQEKYDMLQTRARTPARYLDKQAIGLYMRIKIRELDEVFNGQ